MILDVVFTQRDSYRIDISVEVDKWHKFKVSLAVAVAGVSTSGILVEFVMGIYFLLMIRAANFARRSTVQPYYRTCLICWVDSSEARWLLVIPVMISMLISLLFLINVMRIMLTKSHNNASNNSSTIPVSIRRAVRAALILTPLFGLHHILLPFRPTEKSTAEAVYDVFSALLISLQGLWVSILFCFASVDVHMALKLSYKKLQRTGTHVTHVTATTHQPSFGRDAV